MLDVDYVLASVVGAEIGFPIRALVSVVGADTGFVWDIRFEPSPV